MNKMLAGIGIALLALVVALFIIRLFSHRELDDLSPSIPCDEQLIERSDVLWVIPFFEGNAISENKEWIEAIKSKNKTLGLHGVRHTPKEFNEMRDEEYIKEGIDEFERAFGQKPAIFKAPYLALSKENRNLVERMGMRTYGLWNQITHKVYHCDDRGRFPNWMIRIF